MLRPLLLLFGLSCLGSAQATGQGLKPLEQPRAAPAFTLPAIDGTQYRLEDQRGKYLLINFWAVWCSPCRREMPSMERLYQRYKTKDFNLLAVHVGPDINKAREFAQEYKLNFPVLVDEQMALTAWKVRGLPTTYLIGPDGIILARATGDREWDSPAMLDDLNGYLSDQ